jgi:hypothetical protein
MWEAIERRDEKKRWKGRDVRVGDERQKTKRHRATRGESWRRKEGRRNEK